jgi:hypothetical protein
MQKKYIKKEKKSNKKIPSEHVIHDSGSEFLHVLQLKWQSEHI